MIKKRNKLFAMITLVFLLGSLFTSTITVAETGTGDPNLVGYWKFDGDLTDASSFKNDGVQLGNISFVDGIFGKAAKFDGNSYIEVKDSDSLDIEDKATFSFWVYKDDPTERTAGIPYLAKGGKSVATRYAYSVYEHFYLSPQAQFNADNKLIGPAKEWFDLQNWMLVTITYDGNTARMYYDGRLIESNIKKYVSQKSDKALYIGWARMKNQDVAFKGLMDDLRIYNRALSDSEVRSLYAEGTIGSGKDLLNVPKKRVAYYSFDKDYSDASGMKNDGVYIGDELKQAFEYGAAGKGAVFGGAGYVEVQDSDSLDIDKGFTLGAWIKKKITGDRYPILAKYGASFTPTQNNKHSISYDLFDYSNRGQLLDFYNFTKQGQGFFYSGKAKDKNQWFYYSVSYDGKKMNSYINGSLTLSKEVTGEIAHSTGPLWIGGSMDERAKFFTGTLDELELYNYAMTTAEIKALSKKVDVLTVADTDTTKLANMKVNQIVTIKVNRKLIHESNKLVNVTSSAKYLSSNASVVKVDGTGKFKALKKGTATITVTSGACTKTLSVKVK